MKRIRGKRLVLIVPFVLAACATAGPVMIGGVAVPRIDYEMTGQAYSLKHVHAHPRPGGPSSGTVGDGGSIGGSICGMQIDYDVQHAGDHIQLLGNIDGGKSSQLKITEAHGQRIISGALYNRGVELHVFGNRIEGHVGTRVFAVEQEEDRLIGFMRAAGLVGNSPTGVGVAPVVINGRDAFWSLPAAAQAVVLPNLLTCWTATSEVHITTALQVGFGGPATALPPETSSLYGQDF